MSQNLRPISLLTILILVLSTLSTRADETTLYLLKDNIHSSPQPFENAADWPANQGAISSGYYMQDASGPVLSPPVKTPRQLVRDLDVDTENWLRIVSGPNQVPIDSWNDNPDGLAYFRNPGDKNDSTDNAFAGPIYIGFEFEFNGVRYDSIYVSSNGIIALSNRRYHYNQNGQRVVPAGQSDAWNSQSDDSRERVDPLNTKGLNDPLPDNWGYQFLACGGKPDDPSAGIRSPNNSTFDDNALTAASLPLEAAIIAPFWDDWQLPQFDPVQNRVADIGQVWIKRSVDSGELTIKYVNLVPMGEKQHPDRSRSDIEFKKNEHVDAGAAFAITANIVLNSQDNSISVLYESVTPANQSVMKADVSAWELIEQNVSIGVRGQALYYDNNDRVRRHAQFTEYLYNGRYSVPSQLANQGTRLSSSHVLQFEQFKNVLRVVDIDYLIPDPETGELNIHIEAADNYEMLVGHQNLGVIQPVVTYQVVANHIQGQNGPNYQPPIAGFKAQVEMLNVVESDDIIYEREVCVDRRALENSDVSGVTLVDAAGAALAYDGKGIPAYSFVEVHFPAFKTNRFLEFHRGRHTVIARAKGEQCSGESYSEEWIADNILTHRLFGVNVLSSFYENASNFSYTRREGPMPSADHWVNLGAQIVSGSSISHHPPPPRDEIEAGQFLTYQSPVIRMNRLDLQLYEQASGGDELRSFPIDLRGHESAYLSFAYQRAGIPPGMPEANGRGWSDAVRVGPEARVVKNGEWATTRPLQQPDLLELHFANPVTNNYTNIVNIPADGWSRHPDSTRPGEFISDNPAFTVFGGGGYRRGFDEEDYNRALTRSEGLRVDSIDSGIDHEFLKAFVKIPDYIMHQAEQGKQYVRFKLAVKAQDHGRGNSALAGPLDDDDSFYIDNVAVVTKTERPDIEVSTVEVTDGPNRLRPASQSVSKQIVATLVNNSDFASRAFAVLVQIAQHDDPTMRLLYQRAQTLPFLLPGTRQSKLFPRWNARQTVPGPYLVCISTRIPGGDPNPQNDSTHSMYHLEFGDVIAYDSEVPNGVNDVAEFAEQAGKGLNLAAQSSGEFNSNSAYGVDAGSRRGQLAMRFEMNITDTLKGYQAYFGGLNTSRDDFSIAVHADLNGLPDPQPLDLTSLSGKRGIFDFDGEGKPNPNAPNPSFDRYGTYLLENEYIINPGIYWMVIEQLSENGFELGGTDKRMGMQTLNYSEVPELGEEGHSVLNTQHMRLNNLGELTTNQTFYMYRNSDANAEWTSFTPIIGNPAYAHLDHSGQVGDIKTYTRGSWIPMLRPYFGFREFSDPPQYLDTYKPVELSEFSGFAAPPNGNELYWETASELDNAGFYVERRLVENGEAFSSIAFVDGAGSSTKRQDYSLLDSDVLAGQSYEYRLRQLDYDGTATLSHTLLLHYDLHYDLQISSRPNPFVASTNISFAVPVKQGVKLEIYDMFGKLVRLLHDSVLDATAQRSFSWDTLDELGRACPAGAYVCRLSVGSATQTQVLTLLR